jgi:hypothetical protein
MLVTTLFCVCAEETEDQDTEQPVPLQPAEEIQGQDEHQAMPLDPASAANQGAQTTAATQFLLRCLAVMPCAASSQYENQCLFRYILMHCCSLCHVPQALLLLQNLRRLPFRTRR